MTTKAPPIDPGNIRVILHMEDQPFADLHGAKLPEWFAKLDEFAGYIPTPPLVEGTGEGARSARTLFMRAFGIEEGYALGATDRAVDMPICPAASSRLRPDHGRSGGRGGSRNDQRLPGKRLLYVAFPTSSARRFDREVAKTFHAIRNRCTDQIAP